MSMGFQSGLFAGKQVVITGAGRGIGAALARYLFDDGAHVLAHLGREANRARWCFPSPADVDDERLSTVCADLATVAGVDLLLHAARDRFAHLDVLVNNAGTMLGRVLSADMSAAHFARVTDLNARSVVLITTGLLPLMRKAQAASVVNVTSISAATGGSPGSSVYSAAKGFVSTYTRALATELAADGIRVNAISPGTIATDFHQRYSSAEKLAVTAARTPLQRLGTAQDCVPACLFLAENSMSGFMTGQILGINGGAAY